MSFCRYEQDTGTVLIHASCCSGPWKAHMQTAFGFLCLGLFWEGGGSYLPFLIAYSLSAECYILTHIQEHRSHLIEKITWKGAMEKAFFQYVPTKYSVGNAPTC